MNTEEYENRGFPFRDFLLKLILVIIFVFLLVWLLPKFITPKVIENNNDSISNQLSALTSQIFADNLERMKNAAILYYTEERLPKKIGDSDKMTLGDMIGKKLITPLIDKNNQAVDVEGSYVKITKADNEYILKVNIKDSEKEDYILVHIGCYAYCESYLCEKRQESIIVKGDKPTNTPRPTNPTTPSPNPTTPSPNPTTPSPNPTTPSPAPTTPSPSPTTPTYVYEYQKTTGVKFSDWTLWSAWKKTNCKTKAINCNDNSTKCLMKLQLYSRKEYIGTYQARYVTKKNELVQTGSYPQKACANYNYVIVNNTTYTTTNTYNKVSQITNSTKSSSGDWQYNGRKSYANPPKDTANTHYEFVGADYSYCGENCTSLPNFYYDSYTYKGSMKQVSSTTTVPEGSTTSNSTNTTVTATCGEYVTREIPIYSIIVKGYLAERTEPLYGTVCYQSTKTRKLLDKGKVSYKWSKYNDKNLLSQGWTYTGAKKIAG